MPQFTLTTSYNTPSTGSPLSVVFNSTYAGEHYLKKNEQFFGIGSTSALGVPSLSASFQGFFWDADVAATYGEYLSLCEIFGSLTSRYENNQGGYLILKDELNYYPESQHGKYGRSVVAGSSEVVNGFDVAHLAFPVRVESFDPVVVKTNKDRYSVSFQLTEIPL